VALPLKIAIQFRKIALVSAYDIVAVAANVVSNL
jgi:hypothetical protein